MGRGKLRVYLGAAVVPRGTLCCRGFTELDTGAGRRHLRGCAWPSWR